jgi:hypothetical protein
MNKNKIPKRIVISEISGEKHGGFEVKDLFFIIIVVLVVTLISILLPPCIICNFKK